MDTEEMQEQNQFEELIQGLIDNKYGCCNNFMKPDTITGLRNNSQRLSESGNMKPSGVGNKNNFHQDNTIRGDTINWIETQSTNAFELTYLKKMEKFINHLNKTCYTSLKSFESHYATYEKERFYKRHLDQFKNEKGREFSTILYLNHDWKQEDGGMLSLYPKHETQINIAPLAGRMIFFRSAEMEHEVHASHTNSRRSIAGWLKN